SKKLDELAKAEGLPAGRFVVHGSRAAGRARPGKDVDVLYIVSESDFDSFVAKRVSETSGRTSKNIEKQARNQRRVNARGISRTFEGRVYDTIPLPSGVSKVQISVASPSSVFRKGPYVTVR